MNAFDHDIFAVRVKISYFPFPSNTGVFTPIREMPLLITILPSL
jgi:hypothetical protein